MFNLAHLTGTEQGNGNACQGGEEELRMVHWLGYSPIAIFSIYKICMMSRIYDEYDDHQYMQAVYMDTIHGYYTWILYMDTIKNDADDEDDVLW